MYTGIVEGLGSVLTIIPADNSQAITIQPAFDCSDLKLGDSIAVNGVCLTVSQLSKELFTADVVKETLQKTTLGNLVVGQTVNLERCLKVGDRLGGHFVSGHIDCTAEIITVKPSQGDYYVTIRPKKSVMKFIANKGSITIDGMSITVVESNADDFTVTLIPHTLSATIANSYQQGTLINLEVDMLAKYLDRLEK